MSILLAQVPTTESAAPTELIISVVWGLAALYVLVVPLGFLRPRNILGPPRLEPGEGAWPLGVVLLIGLFVWMGIQSEYLAYAQLPWVRAGSKGDPPQLGPGDNAFLSTVPGFVALGVMVLGDVLARAALPARLGYLPRWIWRGAASGALALILALPFIEIIAGAQQWLMDHWHYEHPSEHELLQSLGQATSPLASVCIIVGATVAAPLCEEWLFRGHLQTLLRQLLGGRRQTPVSFSLSPDIAVDLAPAPAQPPASPWPAWGAVLITSALFTVVHPFWEWGAIFPLAVCLGYVYERTGNLWSAVTAHLLFNSISTATFMWTL